MKKFALLVAASAAVGCATLSSSFSGPRLPASGAFVTQLGVDTTSIERYTRTADRLEGDVVLRSPRVRVYHYSAGLDANGRITSLTTTVRRPSMAATAPALMSQTITFGPTTTVETMRNGQRDTTSGVRNYEGVGVASLPTEPPSYAIYEQIIASNLPGNGTSRLIEIGGPGPKTAEVALTRTTPDSVQFSSNFFPPTPWIEMVAVRDGRVVGVNSAGTTVKTVSHRDDNLDFNGVLNRWVAQEAAGASIGQLSPLDTTRATVSGASIEVIYSRPSRRGRVIWGVTEPWGEIWRTGANAATQLTTSRDLVFGNTVVPAGKYTLWTLVDRNSPKLIINSQTGQWGTDYDPKRDYARVDLSTTMLPTPVEKFTISVDPAGNGGVLRLAWADRAFSVPFTVR